MNIDVRNIKVGDVLFRYLTPYSVWHYGIVIDVVKQNANQIYMLELADSSGIQHITLTEFMYGRNYFWIDEFRGEITDENSFDIRTRINRAIKLYHENKLLYTMNYYNCEYFVRRCVFKDPKHWESKQSNKISESRLSFYKKMGTILLYGLAEKYYNLNNIEKNSRPTNLRYYVDLNNGKIFQKFYR